MSARRVCLGMGGWWCGGEELEGCLEIVRVVRTFVTERGGRVGMGTFVTG